MAALSTAIWYFECLKLAGWRQVRFPLSVIRLSREKSLRGHAGI